VYLDAMREWFRVATGSRSADDRFGLVVFDGKAVAVSAPAKAGFDDANLDVSFVPGTSLGEAIRLGLAMFPPDTARRLVLVTDGNETVGDALGAAEQASGAADPTTAAALQVPIDVVPVIYEIPGDVQIVRLEAPNHAQPGQTVTVRVLLEATRPTRGRLTLRCEGQPVDLNGEAPGHSRPLELRAGRSAHLASVVLGDSPVNRFEALFDPDDAADDALPDNNRAEAFTPTPSKGEILVITRDADPEQNLLGSILRAAELPVVVRPPALMPDDLLGLQNYDLIALDNIPAFELTSRQHELLARYASDLGGGILMIGGDDGFGAGGWNGTALEAVLPLELDPPRELRLPQAALVLVLDQSGSMNRPVGGARATQQRVANEAAAMAIESLRHESLVGVVTFNTQAREYVPIERNSDPDLIAQRVRRITAGGGTELAPALRLAHRMLRDVDADRKRVVCLTDGQSPAEELNGIVERMAGDDIKLSTIAVGDEADHPTLARLAEIGGGEFYPVYNPRALPRFMVDAVQSINKPLLKEVPFTPVVEPTGSRLTLGFETAPPLGGLVVTAPKPERGAVIELRHPDGEPLLAHWQAGLGRVAAFTSDLGGRWSDAWRTWPTAASFWTQLARLTARPTSARDSELIAVIEDGQLTLTLEASGEDEGFIDYLEVVGTVYPPSGDPIAVRLEQVGAGVYATSIPVRAAGNYIAALTPRRGERRLSPVIGGASLNTGEEFRRYRSNPVLLERIAAVTGGRRLDLTDPAGAALFDRTGMTPSVSLLPTWRAVLIATLVMLLLDIASRRIAWSSASVARRLRAAVARVNPGQVRGRAATATLASLRTVSTQLDATRERETERVAPLPKPSAVAPPVRTSPPESSRVSAALGSLFRRSRPVLEEEPPVEAATEETPSEREPDDDPETSPTTSGLLAAKRRTRKQLGG
ncbi:MAG: VWA domain-containing protein, partial [Phycisphaerales bacterium]|nr:VWA domain-containing protein [Phycisphaerae bacterium]NNM25904.1 VWA domain-containing protein [Phycisphaerales bacterium]